MMPTVDCDLITRGTDTIPRSGYRSHFSHSTEVATPGYYSVMLDDYDVRAELTATLRAGMHRYTFPEEGAPAVVVDLAHTLHNAKNMELEIKVLGPAAIEGVKVTRGWAKNHRVYFYAEFSKPFEAQLYKNDKPIDTDTVSGDNVKALLRFADAQGGKLMVKVGISAVDNNGARSNVTSDIPGWNFDRVVSDAAKAWNDKLARIDVETDDEMQKRIFYTAYYHTMISPNTFVDADGRYRGQDLKIHTADDGRYYTIFSLWDTFRGLHPLLTLTDPELNEAFVRTLLKKYDEGGCLPMWDLASNYTGTMIGYHAVSIIVEAYMKGARNFDVEKAFEACIRSSRYHDFTAQNQVDGLNTGAVMPIGKYYKDSLGYIPCDMDIESVAKGLEYAYNDWCIAQFARALGKDKEYEEFSAKAMHYKNYFDSSTGFMRGKRLDGTWNTPFNPRALNHRKDDYCEGNAWQWSWYATHDVGGLVALHGGREGFIAKLDSLFTISSQLEGPRISGDVTGLIGQYAHGNEPSHHITHLYNYVGENWKTQRLVDSILYNLYFDDPNGLSGNEDCGQMSAWYILNAIGFYPVAPAEGIWSIGRPIFDRVTIPVSDGKILTVVAINNSRENKYVQSVKVNGNGQDSPWLRHDELMNGATVEITMGSEPNKEFGKKEAIL
jgi:predicted alpha-1,2-mannosidase